jgi:hypothetical protein
LGCFTTYVSAQETEKFVKGNIYKLSTNIVVKDSNGDDHVAWRKERFQVLQVENDFALISFLKIYKFAEDGDDAEKHVNTHSTYKLPIKVTIDSVELLTLNISEPSNIGLVSGPLIVPFKWRIDDDTLTGDATIGLYAGYRFEPQLFSSNVTLPITPFISAGLAQISVNNTETEDSDVKTGVTLALGMLWEWDDVTIGVVYGQDRIGDSEWEHEGEGWLSISVGWKFE